ncbi:hypothetical protein C8R46DRAFT_1192475 [Mycena filopes]|nr:hypothetical protein C8R46DRAFT_1192475 [Mycena filopes]
MLQHPLALKDLTVHAPRDLGLRSVSMFHQFIENYCPQTRHCPELAYVTYAAYSAEGVNERGWGLKGSMFVRLGSRLLTAEEEDESIKEEKKNHPNFSTAYIVLLKETRGMCGVMSLVASRFYAWTKPITFHSVTVRRNENWVQRVDDYLLPNANLIHVLVLELPNTVGNRERAQFSEEEGATIAQLLEAAGHVKHLAVTWNIWADLERECGAIRVENLYLIWDGAMYVDGPDLGNLQHPAALKDLMIYAHHNLGRRGFSLFHQFTINYCPQTGHCPNLAYVTYAVSYGKRVNAGHFGLKGSMFVRVGSRVLTADEEEENIKVEKERHTDFSTAYVGSLKELLEEWVAKAEGRPSVLIHPPPREA